MMKKAQDFLVDSKLGEKSYKIDAPADAEKIVLSIEDGAIPVSLLKDLRQGVRQRAGKSWVKAADDFVRSLGSPSAKDKATFFRLLAIMLNAGVPLIKSLDTISEQTMNNRLKMGVFEISREIEKGGSLSKSMEGYPSLFTEEQLGMIRAGEAAGQINKVLIELALEVEKSASINRKVIGAMMYPAFISVVLIGVVCLLMIKVVPPIADIFKQGKAELPQLTKIVIALADFITKYWPVLIGGFVGLIVLLTGLRRTQQGRYAMDWVLLRIPVFGGIIKKSVLARFSRSLGSLLSSGVPIIQGLLINARGLGNVVYQRRVELASEDIARGIPLGESLRDSPEFPTMMVQMISVGEQTAQLDTIAVKVAEYYEDEIDTTVASLSSVLEPVILVIVGIVVGGIIGAVILPMIQLTQLAGSL